MSTNIKYQVGNILRRYPEQDDTFEVTGFVLELLEVKNTRTGEPKIFHPDEMELFTFSIEDGRTRPYSQGDRVRLFGREGDDWVVQHFTQSRVSGEILVVCENIHGTPAVVPAHNARWVRSPMDEGIGA